jgi:hypothetical protein
MKFKIIIILLTLSSVNIYSQAVTIDTLYLEGSKKHGGIFTDKLMYPIVRTSKSYLIDSLINYDIRNKLTYGDYADVPLKECLNLLVDDQLVYLGFEVLYNKNGVLSLRIDGEGCGAYCTNFSRYCNYFIETGKIIEIINIVDTNSTFKDLVYADKNEQYNLQKIELKERLTEPVIGFDKASYNSIIEYYYDCEQRLNLENFLITEDYLEIIEECSLPNVIKSMTPIIDLKYNYKDIEQYLLFDFLSSK